MRFFDHPHIIRLYGVAAIQEPLMLVMELVSRRRLGSVVEESKREVRVMEVRVRKVVSFEQFIVKNIRKNF